MPIQNAILFTKNLSTAKNIQLLLLLVSVSLSLKNKYYIAAWNYYSSMIAAKHLCLLIFLLISILAVLDVWSHSNFLLLVLLLSGDVVTNPGPKGVSKDSFSICHWNPNSITTHNYTRILLLKAYMQFTVHKYVFDIICLSETYLD